MKNTMTLSEVSENSTQNLYGLPSLQVAPCGLVLHPGAELGRLETGAAAPPEPPGPSSTLPQPHLPILKPS